MTDSSSGSPPSPDPPPGWLRQGLEHLQDSGLSIPFAGTFVGWWSRVGLARALLLTLAVAWPVLRFQALPAATSSLVESVAERQGLRLQVDAWSVSLARFAATAHGVRIETGGGYREPYLLRADAIEIDASLWQNVGDGLARLRHRLANVARWLTWRSPTPLPPRAVGRRVTVTGAELYLERLISGRGNWQDVIDRTTAPGTAMAEVEAYYVPRVDLRDFRIVYVEHLPAGPEAGLEQSLTSTLRLDDATLTLADFAGPGDDRDNPTDFSLDGRIGGDGRLSMTGAFNLWQPSFALDVSVNNLGAATLGILSPEASVIPSTGTVTGHLALAVRDGALQTCDVNLRFTDVRYRPNPRSPFWRSRAGRLAEPPSQVPVNAPVRTPCTGNWSDPDYRPLWAIQSSVTAVALQEAPAEVRAAVRYDQTRFTQALSPAAAEAELRRITGELTAELGQQVGEAAGNAVTRGLSSVGRGVARLFGRKNR